MSIRRLVYILTATALAAVFVSTIVSCQKAGDGTAAENVATEAVAAAENVATEVVTADDQATKEEMAEFLFVQYAESATLSEGVLTLKGVVPETLYFSDRPHRIVGRVTTGKFVKSWDEGEGSFSEIPPNAVLAVMHKPVPLDLIVVLKNPVLEGDTLTYQVEVLDGPDSGEGEASALFIDTIGFPLLEDIGDSARETVDHIDRRVTDYGDSYDDDYDDLDDRDAYRDGYRDAWYDNSYDNEFDDPDEQDAYREGYEDGQRDVGSHDDDYDDPDDRDAYQDGYDDGQNDYRYDDDFDDSDEQDAYREGYEDGRRDGD